MTEKHKRVCRASNQLKRSLVFFSDISDCALDIDSVLISKALRVSHSDHDEFFSVTKVFRKYNETKEEIKNRPNTVTYLINNGNVLRFKKNTARKNTIVRRTKQNRSNRNETKSNFIKNQASTLKLH